MGTLSFQVSQEIKPGDDISLSASTVKCFLNMIEEKYALLEKIKHFI